MLQNNANDTWLKQVEPLVTMEKVCLSAKLTCAQDMEPLGFLGHTLSCLEAPFHLTAKVTASLNSSRQTL